MGDSILSQAEIDALLNGDSEVKDEPTASVSGESDIRPYDPNTQRRVVRERLQALEIINERFARHFRMGLFNLLRRSPDITVGAIRIQPYHEFARNLPVPTNLNLIHLKPLRGTGLVVFSPSLVFIAVDNLFGGDGRFPTKVEGREFTHTEQRVINRMLKLALEGYSDAWKAINPLEVEYVRSEMQVKFTNITTSPNDIVVNTPFHVTRIIIVFGLLRNALGTPSAPPNQVLLGLALFLTFFIMSPVIDKIYVDAYQPFSEEKISMQEALEKGAQPLREFMLRQTREADLGLFARLANTGPLQGPEAVPMRILLPAYVTSELKTAFQIGFTIFIPFLIIDLVIASVLMALGMMMVPPATIALPFKLMLFVLVDGWQLLVGSLAQSFYS
ncbi:flagellar type III secretion system pore protein FliP [Escherichia coli]|nr:flagellar type III secretion system pore protein FliP [Escherichia coli]